jgi:GNAT superfamily N-acetyltransferase
VVDELTVMINAAYAAGEQGMWKPNQPRTTPATVRQLLDKGELLTIERDGVLAGCVRVRELDERTGELGMLSAARDGSGVGRELIALAEDWARGRGRTRMRLQLLVPKRGIHPFKVRLDGWYKRLGYEPVGADPFDHPGLAAPCDLVNYERTLA